ncbi:hypothetical protein, partial [Paenibacillus sp. P3E]|uniref:hypothetical protein n=1 Tax=Paenibacillus sp. P3E TaxID=1349435 RepID=UPI001C4A2414
SLYFSLKRIPSLKGRRSRFYLEKLFKAIIAGVSIIDNSFFKRFHCWRLGNAEFISSHGHPWKKRDSQQTSGH